MMPRLAAALCVLVLTACSGSDEPSPTETTSAAPAATSAPPEPSQALEAAVRAYSKAFLGGDGAAAYALLSERCQDVTPLSEFAAITEQAEETYGPLKIDKVTVTADGKEGAATYTYPVATLNQGDEPWVDENGWKNDDC